MKKKIAFISMGPELIPRNKLQAETLVENGFDIVHVGWDRRKDFPKTEMKNDVRHIRVSKPSYTRSEDFKADIQSDYTMWGVAGQNGLANILFLPILYKGFYQSLRQEKFDVIQCSHVALLPLAVLLGITSGIKIVYEAVEFYISQAFDGIKPSLLFLKRFAIAMEGFFIKFVNAVLCIPSTDRKLFKTYSKYNRNVIELANVPIIHQDVDNVLLDELIIRNEGRFVFIYAGAIAIDKGILKVVKAVEIVKKRHPDIKLTLIGSAIGDDSLAIGEFIEKKGLSDNVELVPFQPYEKLFTYYYAADVGIGLIQKKLTHKFTTGGSRKIIEYMKASLALLVTDDGEVGEIARKIGCGIRTNIWDEKLLAKTMAWFMENPLEANKMGKRGLNAHLNRYNWDHESDKYMRIIRGLD